MFLALASAIAELVTARKGEELVVLGDKIRLAVHFHQRAALAVATDIGHYHAFRRYAGSRLARLVAEPDAQYFLGPAEVTAGLGQGLLALHHRGIGLLA